MEEIRVKAYAKLNLTLDIVGKLENGYHELDSVMVSVEPYDVVTLKKASNTSVNCSDSSLAGEENIAFKAANAFFEYTKINGGAEIYIEKHIPQAAGLGGGSADAAAVIRGLNELYCAGLSYDVLREIGLKVGADVPFCIEGGIARARGIGERIEKLPFINGLKLIILKKGFKASTGAMYAAIDAMSGKLAATTSQAVEAIENKDNIALIKNISNHFAAVCAEALCGHDALKQKADAFSLSGSGPTIFAVFTDEDKAESIFEELYKGESNCFLSDIKPSGIVFE